MKKVYLMSCIFLLIALITGCGYSTDNLIREDIDTVAIPVFDNTTRYNGLEVDLTKALVQEIKLHTSLRIAERESAESTLKGTLISYKDDIADRTEDEEVLLRRATVTVRFSWIDNYTGQKLLPEKEVTESETLALGREEAISNKLFQETAQKMVEQLEKNW